MPVRFVLGARLVFAAFAIFALSAAAEAQYLTFVSATGLDSRPCTVQAQPCRTLQRAVSVAGTRGTIRILSDLPGQNATIAKSLTVEGGGNTMIGRIVINSASAVVVLRALNLTGRGVHANGISITSAAAVHIEDSSAERYTGDGIRLAASTATKLFVSDTVSRDNGANGLYASDTSARVVVENSRFEGNTDVGLLFAVARASVTRSVASGNHDGISVSGGAANITETTATDNADTGIEVYEAVAILASSVASSNGSYGLYIWPSASAEITDSVFTHNAYGIYNRGALYTRANNTLNWNVTDYFNATGSTKITAPAF